MQTDDVVIRINGQQLDPGGPQPENIVLTSNDWGNDRATFDLRRHPSIPWPDLAPRSPVEIEIAGTRVWKGRIKATPGRSDTTITVDCVGLQYALDDVPFRRLYVHSNMGDWENWATHPNAEPATYTNGFQIETGGAIMIRNDAVTGSFPRGGVYLDLGQDDMAKRVVVTWSKNQWAGTSTAYFYASDTVGDLNTAAGATSLTNLASATTSGTFAATTSARYLLIFCDTDTAQASDRYFRTGSILVFGNTAWESGNTSTLTSSDVVEDAILQAKGWTDTSRIQATSGVHLQLDALDFATGRELIETVNEFEGNVRKVDADGLMVYKPRPTTPLFTVNDDYEFTDGSLNSDDDVYDEVAIVATGGDGKRLIVERTQTGTLYDNLSGESNKKIVDVGGAMEQTQAESLGDAFLAAHQQSPFKGSVTVTGMGPIRDTAGAPTHPSRMLRETGEMVSLPDQIDPTRKVVGRRAYLMGVKYIHDGPDGRTVELELDASRSDFGRVIARYQVGWA